MNVYNIYQELIQDDFCFGYTDKFSDDATDGLIAVQEARTETGKKIKKRISFLVTECFQNIVRHAEDIKKEHTLKKLFCVRNIGENHCIATVNPILKERQLRLKQSLDSLQNLSEQELKQAYLDTLTNESFSDKGGAGLGLIEMARKSKQPLSYDFLEVNETMSQFTLQVNLNESKEKKNQIPISKTSSFFDMMKENDILLLQKGNFSQDAVVSLFELFENNVSSIDDHSFSSTSLYLMIELLQNMSVNAVENDGKKVGIFVISLDPKGRYGFHTGNFVNKEDGAQLKSYLDSLEGLSKIDLAKKYKQELQRGIKDPNNRVSGIGLIEIFKLSGGNLEFNFEEIDDQLTFVSFSTLTQA